MQPQKHPVSIPTHSRKTNPLGCLKIQERNCPRHRNSWMQQQHLPSSIVTFYVHQHTDVHSDFVYWICTKGVMPFCLKKRKHPDRPWHRKIMGVQCGVLLFGQKSRQFGRSLKSLNTRRWPVVSVDVMSKFAGNMLHTKKRWDRLRVKM